jgi:hypothetical protein
MSRLKRQKKNPRVCTQGFLNFRVTKWGFGVSGELAACLITLGEPGLTKTSFCLPFQSASKKMAQFCAKRFKKQAEIKSLKLRQVSLTLHNLFDSAREMLSVFLLFDMLSVF